MKKALSVEVEEYFQGSAFEKVIDRQNWPVLESRLGDSLHDIPGIFDRHETLATLFVRGWISKQHQKIIRKIHFRRHKIASHVYSHQLIYQYFHNRFIDFPFSTIRFLGINMPIVGGGYLRFFPRTSVRWGFRRINRKEGKPVILYFHPWKIDPDPLGQPVGVLTRFRHYHNIEKMGDRVEQLLRHFPFTRLADLVRDLPGEITQW